MFCGKCAELTEFNKATSHQFGHGHFLALIRNMSAPSVTGHPADAGNVEDTANSLAEDVERLHGRMERMEERLNTIAEHLEALIGSMHPADVQ